jgi:adenosyl cobinamide kinase/adenosyl cobinamide phosphate guanylyltransferase
VLALTCLGQVELFVLRRMRLRIATASTANDPEMAARIEQQRAEPVRTAVAARQSHLILVSHEFGSGTVPEPAVTRARKKDDQ